MRTAILSPGYLGDTPADLDDRGNNRILRAKKYVAYYKELMGRLNAQWIYFCDNGSAPENIAQVGGLTMDPIDGETSVIDVSVPVTHLLYPNVKKTSIASYPYCWRAVWEIRNLLTKWGYDRVIFIDSDLYLISRRIIEWVSRASTGWRTVQCRKYGWPAPELQIVTKDCKAFMDYTSDPDWMKHDTKCMELSLPFTFVSGQFNYARYGEDFIDQKPDMDAYGQCEVTRHIIPEPPMIRLEAHGSDQ